MLHEDNFAHFSVEFGTSQIVSEKGGVLWYIHLVILLNYHSTGAF